VGQQTIKCGVTECLHWAAGDNCDLHEIWVRRKAPGTTGDLVGSAVGQGGVTDEDDTFCASFDRRH
jgi:hypothetical protein